MTGSERIPATPMRRLWWRVWNFGHGPYCGECGRLYTSSWLMGAEPDCVCDVRQEQEAR